MRPDSTAALLREIKSLSRAFSFCILPEGMTYQLERAEGRGGRGGIKRADTALCLHLKWVGTVCGTLVHRKRHCCHARHVPAVVLAFQCWHTWVLSAMHTCAVRQPHTAVGDSPSAAPPSTHTFFIPKVKFGGGSEKHLVRGLPSWDCRDVKQNRAERDVTHRTPNKGATRCMVKCNIVMYTFHKLSSLAWCLA